MNRKNILFLACLFLCSLIFAETETSRLKNGIPVYYNKTSSKVCAVYIVVNAGISEMNVEHSGLESSLFKMMTKGSENFSSDEIDRIMFRTKGQIDAYSLYSGSVLGLSCIDYYADELLPVMLEGFVKPSYEPDQVKLLTMSLFQKNQQLLNDPVSLMMYKASKEIYKGHPFEVSANVTPDSISNITVDAMKEYHQMLLKDSGRISVIAVGNLNKRKLVSILEKYLGSIPEGERIPVMLEVPPLKDIKGQPEIYTHDAAGISGYAVRLFKSPSVLSSDYVPSRICEEVYSTILFNVVREKYGVCYTPQTGIFSSLCPLGYDLLYKISDFKDFTIRMKEAEEIMSQGKVIVSVDGGEMIYDDLENKIEGYINTYINQKYENQKTASGIASRLASSLLQFGDIHSSDFLTEKAKQVTAGDVLRVFEKYWLNDDYRWFAISGSEKAKDFDFKN